MGQRQYGVDHCYLPLRLNCYMTPPTTRTHTHAHTHTHTSRTRYSTTYVTICHRFLLFGVVRCCDWQNLRLADASGVGQSYAVPNLVITTTVLRASSVGSCTDSRVHMHENRINRARMHDVARCKFVHVLHKDLVRLMMATCILLNRYI
jgi:hypothetical protein